MTDSTPPGDIAPLPVLAYSGATQLLVVDAGEMVIITAPARGFVRQILWRAFVFLLCGLPAASLVINVLDALFYSGVFRLDKFACALVPTWAAVHSLIRLIYVAREGHRPTHVRVWSGGIEFRGMGKLETVMCNLPRDQVRDLRFYPNADGFGAWATLEVISCDGVQYKAPIPWQENDPIIEVENNMRVLLGLAPTEEFKAFILLQAKEQAAASDGSL